MLRLLHQVYGKILNHINIKCLPTKDGTIKYDERGGRGTEGRMAPQCREG